MYEEPHRVGYLSNATRIENMEKVDKTDLKQNAIITPPEYYAELDKEFNFDFDPCPYPRPEGFDGLKVDWGKSNYCNPLFWGGGITAWVRKALTEAEKGNLTVLNLPLDNWASILIERANPKDIRVRRDWYWITPEGKKRKPSRPCLLWIVRPIHSPSLKAGVSEGAD